jgi:hypothetical protein
MRVLALVALMFATASAAPADTDSLAKAAPACDPKRATCLGLAVHVTVDDAGAPIAKPDWLAAQLATANRLYEKLDLGFQIVSVDTLPAAAGRVEDAKKRDSFKPQVTGTVIHVFVTARLDDIDVPGAVIRGVTWRRDANTKFIILSTIAMDRVLAHELGHVFGLSHSTHAISIMNKTERETPPVEQRSFAASEYTAMRARLARLLANKALVSRKK